MAAVTCWTRSRAVSFLGVDTETFDDLVRRYALREMRPGEYSADEVAGLSETMAAAAHEATSGWRGAFYREGFAHLPKAVTHEQMALVSTWALSRLAAGDDQPVGVAASYGPTGQLARVNYLERDVASVALIRELPFSKVAKELVDDAVIYRLSVVGRSLSSPPELGRHRDPRWAARTFSTSVFAIGLSLESAPGDMGDVYYSPGTHRLDVNGLLPDAENPSLPELTISTERGDAVLHNLGVVHGAHRYQADRERVTVYCSFASAREVAHAQWGPLGPLSAAAGREAGGTA